MSPLLRASRPTRAESHRKISKIYALGDPKSTQEHPESPFGALFEPLGSKKSIEEASSSALGATWSVEKACRSDCRGDLGRSWLARAPRERASPSEPERTPLGLFGYFVRGFFIFIFLNLIFNVFVFL